MVSNLLAYAKYAGQTAATPGFEYSYQYSGHMGPLGWLIMLALFFIITYGWYLLDKKLGGEHPIWMFIPILNAIEIFKLGDVSPWKLLWILLPFIGWIILVYYEIVVLVNITKKTGNSGWMVLLMFVPVVNYFYPYIIMPKGK